MPELVVSNAGELHLLQRALLGASSPASVWQIRLYKNAYIPTKDVTLANVTEATFAGYLPITVVPGSWLTSLQPAIGNALGKYTASPQVKYAVSGSQTIYGYYITFDSGATLLLAQAFDAPQVVTPSVPVQWWPLITSQSESQP